MVDIGINHQAMAVAVYASPEFLQPESAWDEDNKRYDCSIRIRPWYNGRETGFVFQYSASWVGTGPWLNIAVFEHRNYDGVCAWMWVSQFHNDQPTIADIPDSVAPDKYTHQYAVGCGQVGDMADWVAAGFAASHGNLAAMLAAQEVAPDSV